MSVVVEVEDVEAQLLGAFERDGVVPEHVNDEVASTAAYGQAWPIGRANGAPALGPQKAGVQPS